MASLQDINASPTLLQVPIELKAAHSNASWASQYHRNFSRNLENEEWSDDEDPSSPEGHRSHIDTLLRKSTAHLAERDTDYANLDNPNYEKQLKKALSLYFDKLNEKFVNEIVAEKKFIEDVKQYILEVSGEEGAKVMQDSDGLLWKSLQLVDNLSVLAHKTGKEKVEKLKLYIAVLATQKYLKTKQNISKGKDEKKFLQRCDKTAYKKTKKWYQVHQVLNESKITLESIIHLLAIKLSSIKQLGYKYTGNSPSWYCEVKIDGISSGKTSISTDIGNPVWNNAIVINLSKDQLFEMMVIEIYESSFEPTLIGECHITFQEILENTLFHKIFRVKLPIIPTAKEAGFQQAKLNLMTEQDVKEYIQAMAFERDNIGLLKVSFDVNLDPSFLDTIEEIREQRLESLEIWAEENAIHLEEQFEFLKFSLVPVNTIEVDKELGIRGKEGIKGLNTEKSECGLCGVNVAKACNIF